MDISQSFEEFRAVAGWFPAVFLPSATVIQLYSLASKRRSDGVSATTWTLFALANFCLYLNIGKWTSPQVVLSTVGTGLLQCLVVALVLRYRRQKVAPTVTGAG